MQHMVRSTPLPVREWSSAEADPAVVIASFLRAHTLLVADLQTRCAEAGLPTLDIARLLWLWSEHTVSLDLRDVASKLGLSRPTASRLVDRAERAKLVARSRDPIDQRDVSVCITAYGRSAIHRLDAVLRAGARELQLDAMALDGLAAVADRVIRCYERS